MAGDEYDEEAVDAMMAAAASASDSGGGDGGGGGGGESSQQEGGVSQEKGRGRLMKDRKVFQGMYGDDEDDDVDAVMAAAAAAARPRSEQPEVCVRRMRYHTTPHLTSETDDVQSSITPG